MNFCRNSCMNIRSDDISEIEKKCIKNCANKYVEQFSILNSYKDQFIEKFGNRNFVIDKKQKEAFDKMVNMIKINNEI